MFAKIISMILSAVFSFLWLFGIVPGVTVMRDVAYASQSQSQKVDIFIPKNKGEELGLMLMIHGGAWISGDKSDYSDACRSISSNYGYITATMNYRLIGEGATCEDMLADITACLEEIKARASDKGVRIKSCALLGGSAGGHLSMLYSYKNQAVSPVDISFCVSLSGPTDLTDPNFYSPENAILYTVAGGLIGVPEMNETDIGEYTEKLKEVSPLSYVRSDVPATLFCHGMKDSIVPYSNAVSLEKALADCKAEYTFITYPNSDHDLAADPDKSDEYYRTLVEYAEKYF